MFSGEPAMVLVAGPGEDGMAVVGDGTVTEPGRYVVACAIPIGADPAEIMAPPSDRRRRSEPAGHLARTRSAPLHRPAWSPSSRSSSLTSSA